MCPFPTTAHELPKLWLAGLDRKGPSDPELGLLIAVQKASSASPVESDCCGNSYSKPDSGEAPDVTDADAIVPRAGYSDTLLSPTAVLLMLCSSLVLGPWLRPSLCRPWC